MNTVNMKIRIHPFSYKIFSILNNLGTSFCLPPQYLSSKTGKIFKKILFRSPKQKGKRHLHNLGHIPVIFI